MVAIGIGILVGLTSGLVKQLSFGAGIILSLFQATIFYPQAAAWLQGHTEWNNLICTIAGFVIVFFATTLIINVIGLLLRWLLKTIKLGWLDRTLGAVLSAIIAMGVVVFGVNISEGIVPDNKITGKTSQEESLLYNKVAEVTFLIIEEAKKIDEKKEQYIEEDCE